MISRMRIFWVATCVTLLAACGGGSGGGSAEGTEGAAPSAAQVTVIFENTQFEDATLYVESAGAQRRLGRIEGTNTERFRTPHSPTGYVFTASYTAIGEFDTDVIHADPGDTITITAQSTGNLVFSIR